MNAKVHTFPVSESEAAKLEQAPTTATRIGPWRADRRPRSGGRAGSVFMTLAGSAVAWWFLRRRMKGSVALPLFKFARRALRR